MIPHELKLLQTDTQYQWDLRALKVTLDTMMSRSSPSTAAFSSIFKYMVLKIGVHKLNGSAPVGTRRYHNLLKQATFYSEMWNPSQVSG